MGHRLRIPMYVFGPEASMTGVVRLALGHADVPPDHQLDYAPKRLPRPEETVSEGSLYYIYIGLIYSILFFNFKHF